MAVMERNPTDNLGTSGAGTGSAGSSVNSTDNLGTGTDALSLGGSDASYGGTSGFADTASDRNVGSTGTTGSTSGGSGVADRLHQARDMAGERLGQAKEKATQLKSSLADRLEAGASSLRQQSQSSAQGGQQLAAAGAGGSSAGLLQNDQIQRLAGPAADAMDRTADFLRNGDVKEMLEEQVRTNPARTLLIALGVGYLLGKAIRR
jgi:ElaB/YqjD/DUF883 family membrane-anchored ribosome-binding protein